MIYSLNGKLIYTDPTTAVVECGGVGYGCRVTYNTLRQLPELNQPVFLFTYMNVREDAVDLFGFYTKEELDCFKLLITVNGVGPKAAISILSELTPNAVCAAISMGDTKTITRAQGIGPKVAQRIVLELKDKVGVTVSDEGIENGDIIVSSASSNNKSEAVSALMSLGYSQSEAQKAVSKCDLSKSTEEVIKDALKYLF
ncbi:MAG: Holliday junction branch migration protein RuvA [Clostridia bacterium]|nr:Holliday junction branch migration protein RuvA [Clostridia bacterium]